MTTWGDLKRQYTKASKPLRELLTRNMLIEMGHLSPWETPMGAQMAGQMRSMTSLGMGQLAQLLNRAGTPGGMISALERGMLDQANAAAQRGVTSLYQKYDPTPLAIERSRHGLELAKLRNEFYRNQLMEDAMNAQDNSMAGLGDLISGGLSLLTGSAIGNPLGSLFKGITSLFSKAPLPTTGFGSINPMDFPIPPSVAGGLF